MINKRRYVELPYGNGDISHKVTIESIDCAKGEQSRYVQTEVFKQLSLNLDLTVCGKLPFEIMTMKHDGQKWIVTLQAIEKHKEEE